MNGRRVGQGTGEAGVSLADSPERQLPLFDVLTVVWVDCFSSLPPSVRKQHTMKEGAADRIRGGAEAGECCSCCTGRTHQATCYTAAALCLC